MSPFLEKVCEIICARFDCTHGELIGQGKEEHLVAARRLVWCIARWHNPAFFTCSELGRQFNRDHSTIIVGWRRHGIKPRKPKRKPKAMPDRAPLIAHLLRVGYGESYARIADQFGCSPRVVSRTVDRLKAAGRWQHRIPKGWAWAARRNAAQEARA